MRLCLRCAAAAEEDLHRDANGEARPVLTPGSEEKRDYNLNFDVMAFTAWRNSSPLCRAGELFGNYEQISDLKEFCASNGYFVGGDNEFIDCALIDSGLVAAMGSGDEDCDGSGGGSEETDGKAECAMDGVQAAPPAAAATAATPKAKVTKATGLAMMNQFFGLRKRAEKGAKIAFGDWSVKRMKEWLQQRNVGFADCVEKSELVARCASANANSDEPAEVLMIESPQKKRALAPAAAPELVAEAALASKASAEAPKKAAACRPSPPKSDEGKTIARKAKQLAPTKAPTVTKSGAVVDEHIFASGSAKKAVTKSAAAVPAQPEPKTTAAAAPEGEQARASTKQAAALGAGNVSTKGAPASKPESRLKLRTKQWWCPVGGVYVQCKVLNTANTKVLSSKLVDQFPALRAGNFLAWSNVEITHSPRGLLSENVKAKVWTSLLRKSEDMTGVPSSFCNRHGALLPGVLLYSAPDGMWQPCAVRGGYTANGQKMVGVETLSGAKVKMEASALYSPSAERQPGTKDLASSVNLVLKRRLVMAPGARVAPNKVVEPIPVLPKELDPAPRVEMDNVQLAELLAEDVALVLQRDEFRLEQYRKAVAGPESEQGELLKKHVARGWATIRTAERLADKFAAELKGEARDVFNRGTENLCDVLTLIGFEQYMPDLVLANIVTLERLETAPLEVITEALNERYPDVAAVDACTMRSFVCDFNVKDMGLNSSGEQSMLKFLWPYESIPQQSVVGCLESMLRDTMGRTQRGHEQMVAAAVLFSAWAQRDLECEDPARLWQTAGGSRIMFAAMDAMASFDVERWLLDAQETVVRPAESQGEREARREAGMLAPSSPPVSQRPKQLPAVWQDMMMRLRDLLSARQVRLSECNMSIDDFGVHSLESVPEGWIRHGADYLEGGDFLVWMMQAVMAEFRWHAAGSHEAEKSVGVACTLQAVAEVFTNTNAIYLMHELSAVRAEVKAEMENIAEYQAEEGRQRNSLSGQCMDLEASGPAGDVDEADIDVESTQDRSFAGIFPASQGEALERGQESLSEDEEEQRSKEADDSMDKGAILSCKRGQQSSTVRDSVAKMRRLQALDDQLASLKDSSDDEEE